MDRKQVDNKENVIKKKTMFFLYRNHLNRNKEKNIYKIIVTFI